MKKNGQRAVFRKCEIRKKKKKDKESIIEQEFYAIETKGSSLVRI